MTDPVTTTDEQDVDIQPLDDDPDPVNPDNDPVPEDQA